MPTSYPAELIETIRAAQASPTPLPIYVRSGDARGTRWQVWSGEEKDGLGGTGLAVYVMERRNGTKWRRWYGEDIDRALEDAGEIS